MGAELSTRVVRCDDAEFEVLARAVLAGGLTLRFRARGISMHPFVRDGDALHVRAVVPEQVRTGDLIFFRNSRDKLLVHRVVQRVEADGGLAFVAKGDRVRLLDGLIPPEDVLGKVLARERRGKVVDLTAFRWRLLNRVLAWLSPFGHRLLPVARGFRGVAASIGRLGS